MADVGLRRELLARHPWLAETERGPQAVEAGECDACGDEARLIATCGPGAPPYLGRRCAAASGVDAWCDGHRDEADAALVWLSDLPRQADDAARLWWVSTGEARLDPDAVAGIRRRALPTG